MPRWQMPRGTRDVLMPESGQLEALRRLALTWAMRFGYALIETPIFEHSGVFLRIGGSTDIVQHESYRFVDAGGDDLTLRPEGTAAVARAYVQHAWQNVAQPVRICYVGPMFRRERPEAGRYRQHTQFGVELYGSEEPLADVDVILLATQIVRAAGLPEPIVRINSIGCAVCRPAYRDAVIGYYRNQTDKLCEDCRVRLVQNPLRVLDCKVDRDLRQWVPDLANFWCANCRDQIHQVMDVLKLAGQPVQRDPYLVRGLDYYVRTVFEIGHPSLTDQVALFGGGRYDGLVGEFGGPAVPAVGFGMGLERLLSALPMPVGASDPTLAYVAHAPGYHEAAYRLALDLRCAGFVVDADLVGRSLKSQLRDAARRAPLVIIVGSQQDTEGSVTVRQLDSGQEVAIKRDSLLAYLQDYGQSTAPA